jgi:hypothetical protein
VAIIAIALLGAGVARAQTSAPSSVPPAGSAERKVSTSCTPYVPKGATAPEMETSLEPHGLSGYAAWLTVKITHGPGETVMPEGFRIQRGSDEMLALREAGWVIPEPEGGVAPRIERPDSDEGQRLTTTVTLPFVPLPKEPGRHQLFLPPIPIAVGRANGQVMTLCTAPQGIVVDDPIANEVDPKVRPNPPPRPQREEWVLAKQVTYAVLGAIALALLLAWLLRRWMKRPKPVPVKPRELPWVAAMKELDAIRTSALLEEGQLDEYFDRVDNCVRFYLGDRYGFDGLESTSKEIRAILKRVYPPIVKLKDIRRFLKDTDLIKFTELKPTREDCDEVTLRAEAIITGTIPPGAVPPGRVPKPETPRRAA